MEAHKPAARKPSAGACRPALAQARRRLAEPLAKAGVRVNMLHDNHVRVSPSVHNDMQDIERLIAALPRA